MKNVLFSVHFDHLSSFIYFVSLLTSSYHRQWIQVNHLFMYTHVLMYFTEINKFFALDVVQIFIDIVQLHLITVL